MAAPRSRRSTIWWRLALFAAALGATTSAAFGAIAPWYPRDGEDTCKVVTNATPRVDTPPPPWQVGILRPPGWVGQDPRVYTVPPMLDCRSGSGQPTGGFACAPTFLPWAKKNCAGLKVLE